MTTPILTDASPTPATHVVSYWRNRRRTIVAVTAPSDAAAVLEAIRIAGSADEPKGLDGYTVAQLNH